MNSCLAYNRSLHLAQLAWSLTRSSWKQQEEAAVWPAVGQLGEERGACLQLTSLFAVIFPEWARPRVLVVLASPLVTNRPLGARRCPKFFLRRFQAF